MNSYNIDKAYRKSIAEKNIELTKEIYSEKKEKIYYSIVNTVKHDVRKINLNPPEHKNPAILSVVYGDTAETGFLLQKEGYNPAILNMASEKHPGGGWRNGSMAQEESLFYRSLYYLSLEDPWRLNPKSRHFYPMEPYEGIYSPSVLFFRDKHLERNDYKYLSCIALPAIRNPVLINNTYCERDRVLTIEKMEGILKIALLHNHDSVVLGAMGAGAFHNPPREVAKLFKKVVEKYRYHFKKIVFAIIDNMGTNNFKIFSEII